MSSERENPTGGENSIDGTTQEYESGLAGEPSINILFAVLAHPHRRHGLDCLREHQTLTLADLADEVAVRENQRPLNEIPAETVQQVYLSLYHTHVPKLEAANLVEYEQARDLVTVGEAIEQVVPFLALVDDESLRAV